MRVMIPQEFAQIAKDTGEETGTTHTQVICLILDALNTNPAISEQLRGYINDKVDSGAIPSQMHNIPRTR
ncbi:MAG: hypothetical protein V7707_06300 [Motiliproteus sp.]